MACNSVELSVITFSSNKIDVVEKLREIKYHENKGQHFLLDIKGFPLLGFDIRTAITQLEFRKKVYE